MVQLLCRADMHSRLGTRDVTPTSNTPYSASAVGSQNSEKLQSNLFGRKEDHMIIISMDVDEEMEA